MGRKLNQTGHHPSIYFQMFDEDKWKMMDKLMILPKYAKSRTSLINRALDYGLPMLMAEEFGEVNLCEEPDDSPHRQIPIKPAIPDETLTEIITLLKRISMNTQLSKSIACSIFNVLSRDLKGQLPNAEAFDNGDLRDTPRYLERKEIQLLKEISGDND